MKDENRNITEVKKEVIIGFAQNDSNEPMSQESDSECEEKDWIKVEEK